MTMQFAGLEGHSPCQASQATKSTDVPASRVSQSLMQDLDHIGKTLRAQRPVLISGSPLLFTSDPLKGGEFRRLRPEAILAANTEPFALVPGHASNSPLLEYENTVLGIVVWLLRIPTTDNSVEGRARTSLLHEAYKELDRIQSHKESEWNRQRAGVPPLSMDNSDVVSTGKHRVYSFLSSLILRL